MRPDLERLGLWDEEWARRRFLETYVPVNTDIIEVGEKPVGVIAVRPEPDALWIEHFYLDPAAQGRGLGRQVLQYVMDAHRDGRPFRLAIDRGSAARKLYERVGFVHLYDDDNGVDQVFGAPGGVFAPHRSSCSSRNPQNCESTRERWKKVSEV
ncbi:GNAT family N-acetyltransferase [Actinoplanes sp. NPDC051411]|uniref:GNAT family N-acetyltransferase n=1 Tax=Actinoplanes sp. NPDC051411 TaxID=3155522 RepID=UPI0034293090